jgi:hypothetical protein
VARSVVLLAYVHGHKEADQQLGTQLIETLVGSGEQPERTETYDLVRKKVRTYSEVTRECLTTLRVVADGIYTAPC